MKQPMPKKNIRNSLRNRRINKVKIRDHKFLKVKGTELCVYMYADREECLLPKHMHYE